MSAPIQMATAPSIERKQSSSVVALKDVAAPDHADVSGGHVPSVLRVPSEPRVRNSTKKSKQPQRARRPKPRADVGVLQRVPTGSRHSGVSCRGLLTKVLTAFICSRGAAARTNIARS